MNDFFNDLKSIKKELVKQEKENKEALKKDSENENVAQRQKRLKNEFIEYMKEFDGK